MKLPNSARHITMQLWPSASLSPVMAPHWRFSKHQLKQRARGHDQLHLPQPRHGFHLTGAWNLKTQRPTHHNATVTQCACLSLVMAPDRRLTKHRSYYAEQAPRLTGLQCEQEAPLHCMRDNMTHAAAHLATDMGK